MEPSYLKLYREGELSNRIEKAIAFMESCSLCPRECEVNRLEGELGFCETGRRAKVSSYNAHFGEESPLVGRYGSGTIFISSCNLLCMFCQNYDISHLKEGVEVEPEHIAGMMIQLSERGCHNINFVTPTHVVPQLLEALILAVEHGLKVPLVYNSGGYDKVETLEILDGIFDIYMPDFKFIDSQTAERLSMARDYPEVAKVAIKEMHRQVGDLTLNEARVAVSGLILRHLVMPDGLAETKEILGFIAKEISKNTYVNIMDQYRPCGESHVYPPIDRRITKEEYKEAIKIAHKEDIHRLDSGSIKAMRWI